MSNETRPEQQTIPLEVMNAELAARLQFTENRLIAMSTMAYQLEMRCSELTASLAERSEEIASLHAAAASADADDVKPSLAKKTK
ncbi:hypothetical protein [Rhizobium sp. AB2/73]|uniref:hypothetical protein n=1 Tax=Rhizobium sp. AB2/73 TaxID=2795216 RepID=UPI001C600F90|nr:hypothetical protein [Rhizobium sp. AB2/73]QYA12120.1 hypothetical protein J5284_16600 [Rhizobium sp. AB2/73]UEQ81949.1 hypothetical protein I8E17_05405 [Rhizobium sp. AB2/73]